jgi:hypothetical protein
MSDRTGNQSESRARRRVGVVIALVALASMFALPATAAGVTVHGPTGLFASPCDFSHRLHDDPIVRPGLPGESHSHDFFGNVSTNAFSTLDSLRAAATACERPQDTAAYWVPTLFQGTDVVTPTHAAIYYTTRGKDPDTIVAFPPGLKVVAGDAHASAPQDGEITNWHCATSFLPGGPSGDDVPHCTPGSDLVLTINFPDCWDGSRVDSPDHASHLAYSRRVAWRGRACPESHPVAVPALQMNVHYRTRGGPDVQLASGPSHTAHADFLNAWDQDALETLVRRCLRGGAVCLGRRP